MDTRAHTLGTHTSPESREALFCMPSFFHGRNDMTGFLLFQVMNEVPPHWAPLIQHKYVVGKDGARIRYHYMDQRTQDYKSQQKVRFCLGGRGQLPRAIILALDIFFM